MPFSGEAPGGPASALSAWLRSALQRHAPDEALSRRAEAAGTDLEALKNRDPLSYMAACAAPLLRTDARLANDVGRVIGRIFPEHQLFRLPLVTPQTDTELRIFPPTTRSERSALDDALGVFVGQPQLREQHLFYRVVGERSGERRELAWPLEPDRFTSGAAFVGPFADQAAADAWGRTHADPRSGVVYDTLPYGGAWFCDLFRGE